MSTDQTPEKTRRNTSKIIAFAAVTAIAIGGAFGVKAVADSKTYQHFQVAAGGMHAGGWGHGERRPFSELSEEEMDERITRIVRHVSIEIDATPDQEQKIIALVTAIARDMRPLRERMMATREEIHDILTADQIDRAGLEKIRTARLAEIDEISKTLVTAVADVAEVLTPEQRRVLDERIREFRSMFHGPGRGHHRRHDRG